MDDRIPEISGSTVVLVGSFNPAIFQPEWFARNGLLSPAEAEAADIKIIVPQVSQFETEKFVLQVTPERFTIGSRPSADPAPLGDLVQGTFFILEHTPVGAMGLNRQLHYPLGSEEDWHNVGDKLAPKDGWNGVLEGRPGMLSLVITTNKQSPIGAKFTVRVEPSALVKHGVFFETNEHYEGPKPEPLKGLMQILSERWEDVPIYASKVVSHILNLGKHI
jgi:hypothetical protein